MIRVLTSLNRLPGNEEYLFIGHWQDAGWLEPLLSERQTLVRAPRPALIETRFKNLKQFLKPVLPAARAVKHFFKPPPAKKISLPVSDGFYESLNCDVIHFPYQDYVVSGVPAVYNPHDLQHLHYPAFFPPEEIERREIIYPAACRAAQTVVTASQFVKQDIIENYKISAAKIEVIPWSPPKIAVEEFSDQDVAALVAKYQLPSENFALYPAMTWEHKNHLRLLAAAARLRDRDGVKINIVCTGHKNSFYPMIEDRLRALKLAEQVKFTGIVTTEELSILYRLAKFVIVPTLFEAASAPLFEAWQHGAPVGCSSVTSLPEQAADAALLFDPFSVEEIAGAMKKLSEDGILRAKLRERGFKRLADFKMEHMAQAYLNVYRKTAGIEKERKL